MNKVFLFVIGLLLVWNIVDSGLLMHMHYVNYVQKQTIEQEKFQIHQYQLQAKQMLIGKKNNSIENKQYQSHQQQLLKDYQLWLIQLKNYQSQVNNTLQDWHNDHPTSSADKNADQQQTKEKNTNDKNTNTKNITNNNLNSKSTNNKSTNNKSAVKKNNPLWGGQASIFTQHADKKDSDEQKKVLGTLNSHFIYTEMELKKKVIHQVNTLINQFNGSSNLDSTKKDQEKVIKKDPPMQVKNKELHYGEQAREKENQHFSK